MQSDNYWLNTRTPCLTYGLRGLSYYKLTVHGPSRDLHSGVFGNTVHEPMTDLILLLGTLVNQNGEILIKGVNELVAPLTDAERYVIIFGVSNSKGCSDRSLLSCHSQKAVRIA